MYEESISKEMGMTGSCLYSGGIPGRVLRTGSWIGALDQAGIAPYELTERETYLLQSLGMETYSQILSYRAPEGARSLDVRVYQLTQEGSWEETDNGGLYSFATSPVELESITLGSQIGFLQQEVEIPVAMPAYTSASQMENLALEDFEHPEEITGMDLVQAVTITFSGQEL